MHEAYNKYFDNDVIYSNTDDDAVFEKESLKLTLTSLIILIMYRMKQVKPGGAALKGDVYKWCMNFSEMRTLDSGDFENSSKRSRGPWLVMNSIETYVHSTSAWSIKQTLENEINHMVEYRITMLCLFRINVSNFFSKTVIGEDCSKDVEKISLSASWYFHSVCEAHWDLPLTTSLIT